MKKDNILKSCHSNLSLFLLERNSRSVGDNIKLDDQHTAVHPGLRILKETAVYAFLVNVDSRETQKQRIKLKSLGKSEFTKSNEES